MLSYEASLTDPAKGKPSLVEVCSILDLVPFNLNDLRLLKDRIFMGNFVINVIYTDSVIIPLHTHTLLLNARMSMGNFDRSSEGKAWFH